MALTETTTTCETLDCDEAREFRTTSPSGVLTLELCITHAEPAEALGWGVTDLAGQPV